MFCAVCRIDGNATGRTVEGTGNAGRRTLAPMCPADRNATAGGCRCAHGRVSGARWRDRNACTVSTAHGCHGKPERGTVAGQIARTVAACCPSGSWQSVRRTAHRVRSCPHLSANVRSCPQIATASRNATGRTARDTGTRHGRTVSEPVRQAGTPRDARHRAQERGGRSGRARTCPASRNATAHPCRPVSGDCVRTRPAHGKPSGEIGTPARLPNVAHGRRTRATVDRDRQEERTRQTTAASDRQRRARFQVPFKAG